MNLYFLVEGKRTESIVYPAWLSILLPELTRTYDPFSITDNQYYLFDGGGYPNILKDMINSIYDINAIGRFDYLVVCLDADDESIAERVDEVRKRIEREGIRLSCKVAVIVQRRCIETWFLGNRDMYTRNSKGAFRKFANFYNVFMNDPEEMQKPDSFEESAAQFHFRYLEAMLKEKGLRYSKSKPYSVCKESYLQSLMERVEQSEDLSSLSYFFNFCKKLRKEMRH